MKKWLRNWLSINRDVDDLEEQIKYLKETIRDLRYSKELNVPCGEHNTTPVGVAVKAILDHLSINLDYTPRQESRVIAMPKRSFDHD